MAADLFGLEQQTPRTNDRPEAAALVEVLKALGTPRRVMGRTDEQWCRACRWPLHSLWLAGLP